MCGRGLRKELAGAAMARTRTHPVSNHPSTRAISISISSSREPGTPSTANRNELRGKRSPPQVCHAPLVGGWTPLTLPDLTILAEARESTRIVFREEQPEDDDAKHKR